MGGQIDCRCLPPAFSEGCPTALLDYLRKFIPEYNWWGNFSDAIDFGSSSFRHRLSIVSVLSSPARTHVFQCIRNVDYDVAIPNPMTLVYYLCFSATASVSENKRVISCVFVQPHSHPGCHGSIGPIDVDSWNADLASMRIPRQSTSFTDACLSSKSPGVHEEYLRRKNKSMLKYSVVARDANAVQKMFATHANTKWAGQYKRVCAEIAKQRSHSHLPSLECLFGQYMRSAPRILKNL